LLPLLVFYLHTSSHILIELCSLWFLVSVYSPFVCRRQHRTTTAICFRTRSPPCPRTDETWISPCLRLIGSGRNI
jgi:hypothetical protein